MEWGSVEGICAQQVPFFSLSIAYGRSFFKCFLVSEEAFL